MNNNQIFIVIIVLTILYFLFLRKYLKVSNSKKSNYGENEKMIDSDKFYDNFKRRSFDLGLIFMFFWSVYELYKVDLLT